MTLLKYTKEAPASNIGGGRLVCACQYLIDDDAQHEDQVDAERPEEDGLGAGQLSAGTVVEDFGGDQLVGLERGYDCGNIFASGMRG
jgi:hypothetical protein